MPGLLCVIPAIDIVRTTACLDSIARPDSAAGFSLADVLVVDNSRSGLMDRALFPSEFVHRDPDGHNLGVARSWNIGAERMLNSSADYLLIMSSSMLFGPVLNATWRWQMDQLWGSNVIEAECHSWHLIAFHRRVFEAVGLFDTNFYPGYIEAEDFSYRMRQVGMEGGWPRASVNAMSTTVAAHSDMALAPPLLAYRERKWGGPKGEEKWTLPFGDKPLGYFEDVPIPELAERYGLGPRGERWW